MDEYINREAVFDEIQFQREFAESNGESSVVDTCDAMLHNLRKIETADVQPVKHGRWENGHCTHCGEDVASKLDTWTDVQNFINCPNCGSKNEDGDSEWTH